MTARDAIRMYWLPTIFMAGWIVALTSCGAAFGWSLAKTACGLE